MKSLKITVKKLKLNDYSYKVKIRIMNEVRRTPPVKKINNDSGVISQSYCKLETM